MSAFSRKYPLNRRSVAERFTVRSNSDGTIGVRGYAAVFNTEAHGEVILPGAFNRSLGLLSGRNEQDDVKLKVDHEGTPLARTKSGTLALGVDDHGLWFDAPSLDGDNPRVKELVSAMSRGDIDQCSFAGYFRTRPADGRVEVEEVALVDVSIVTDPWYDSTDAELTGDRDVDRALMCVRSLTEEQRAKMWTTVWDGDQTVESVVDTDRPAPADASSGVSSNSNDTTDITTESKDAPAIEQERVTYKTSDARALLGI